MKVEKRLHTERLGKRRSPHLGELCKVPTCDRGPLLDSDEPWAQAVQLELS